jgi:hypothetical protein
MDSMQNLLAAIAIIVALVGPVLGAPARSGGSPIPAAAQSAGYTLNTFSVQSNFTSATVDVGITYSSGYKWYFWNFFGISPSAADTTLNTNGTLTTFSPVANANASIATVGKIGSGPGFVGTAFGGGAYFEAEISFNPYAVNTANGWPAVWHMALEHLISSAGVQWTGQTTGYSHFIEVDDFEFDLNSLTKYGGSLHDWYGIYDVTCPPNFCNITTSSTISTKNVPSGTDWTIFHRIGMLWVPATALVNGTVSFYFDDIQMGSPVSYSQFTTQSPPPTSMTTWTYGVIDNQHIPVIIGSGPLANGAITVKSVNVWQSSAANNLTN